MQEQAYDKMPDELGEKIAEAFRVPQTARVAKQVIADRLKELAASGDLQRLSDEEAEMIAELRRFKATTKPGGVFKWQTRPDTPIVESPEVALIAHPQNVS